MADQAEKRTPARRARTTPPAGGQDSPSPQAPRKRAYHSPRRQEAAGITKERIVQAAMNQLQEKGYAAMTLESIAREAGVAPQTVYAVCGSKKGVLAAILENSVESFAYDKLRDKIPALKSGGPRVEAIARFMSLLLENNAPGFQVMRGLGMVSPDLGAVEADHDLMLYEKAQRQIREMAEDGLLRPDIDAETATDVYWALSAPGTHRRLTQLRGWTSERYAAWLAELLSYLLLDSPAERNELPDWRHARN